MTLGRLVGDRLVGDLGSVRLLRIWGVVAAVGLGGALLLAVPGAAIAGLALPRSGLSVRDPDLVRSAAATPGVAPGPSLAAVRARLPRLPRRAAARRRAGELTSLPVALSLVVWCAAATIALAWRDAPWGSGVPGAGVAGLRESGGGELRDARSTRDVRDLLPGASFADL